jgi:hypothetical protein
MPPLEHLSQYACEVARRDTGASLGWLEPTSMTITLRMNGPGEVRASFDAGHPAAANLDVYRRVLRVYRRRPGIGPQNMRTVVFAGHIHDLEDSGDRHGLERVEVVAKDAFEAFIRRYQPWASSYATAGSPAPLYDAVAYLVSDANISAEDPLGLDVFYPHGIANVSPVGAGWPLGTWSWDRHEPMSQAWRRMQEPEQGVGFYFRMIYAGSGGTSLGGLRIALVPGHLASPAVGGSAIPRLEYGRGTLANVAGYRAQRVPPINSLIAVGDNSLAWKQDHEASAADYGLWPTLASFPGETTTARLDTLGRGAWQPYPLDSIRLDLPLPDPDNAGPWTPMLWDDIDIGQGVPVLIRGARRTITGTATIREATVTVPASGVEFISSLILDLPGTS